ncbi:MAG: phosphatase PAP2 family protein [Thermodesulfovibrionales bacterium]|nr:phosphatase PAP2 family protein [Thermodesulfovibrionales bacterium]
MTCIRDFKINYPQTYVFFLKIDPLANFIYDMLYVIVAYLIILGFINNYRRNREILKRIFRSLSYGLVITILVTQIKHLLGRQRPKLGFETVFYGPSFPNTYLYSSFPSGHTTFVFMLATIFSFYLPRFRLIFYILAAWIGFERIEDSAHFPSDVLGGALLGTLIGRFVIYRWVRQKDLPREHNGTGTLSR